MSLESELEALKPYVGTVRDLLWEDISPLLARQFLIDEYGIEVEDDIWAAFMQQRVLCNETVSFLQKAADTLSKTPPEVLHTQLLIALAEAYARQDVRVQRIQRVTDTYQTVHTLGKEVTRWRRMTLVLAVFASGLGVTVVSWLLHG
jgi:hypothetical protein